MKRQGWTERERYRADDGTVPSYELRLTESHWPIVHATTPPMVIQAPMGHNWDREGGYESLDDAMEYAETAYRESLQNAYCNAVRKANDMDRALAFFPEEEK